MQQLPPEIMQQMQNIAQSVVSQMGKNIPGMPGSESQVSLRWYYLDVNDIGAAVNFLNNTKVLNASICPKNGGDGYVVMYATMGS